MLNGSQAVAGGGPFWRKNLHVGGGIQWPLLSYIATQMTVISSCSSLLGSMGTRAHTKYLSQSVGGIVHARRGSMTVSGEGPFWPEIPMSEGGFCGGLFASNVTQMAVISGWYGSYGSMRPRGHVRHLAFGDRGHVKCAMGPKQSLEEVLFGLKSA